MKIPATDLRRKLFITIRGEEALDYGGVAKSVLILKLSTVTVVIVMKIPSQNSLWRRCILLTLLLIILLYPGMLMRPAKCKAKAEARYHKAEAKAKKNREAETELCEAEARGAVLIINY